MTLTTKQQIDMFGCSIEALKSAFSQASAPMLAMSILSDVQELMSSIPDDGTGRTGERLELARQYLNRAKWGIAEYLSHDTLTKIR